MGSSSLGSPRTTVTSSIVQGQTRRFATPSEYSKPIPLLFGTHRLEGNIIYMGPIREEITETVQSGGKGGGGDDVTSTTYRYYVDLAVMFAQGPAVALRRVWGDSKIIFDATKTPSTQIDGLNMTDYLGTEEQLQDPTLSDPDNLSFETPAYRGLVYLVFNDFPLHEFANRVPVISAEWTFSGQDVSVTEQSIVNTLGTSSNRIQDSLILDYQSGVVYAEVDGGDAMTSWSLSAGANASQRLLNTDLAGTDGLRTYVDATETVWGNSSEDSNLSDSVFKYDSPHTGGRTTYDINHRPFDSRMCQVRDEDVVLFWSDDNNRSTPGLILESPSTWTTPGTANLVDGQGTPLAEISSLGTSVQDTGVAIPGPSRQSFHIAIADDTIKIWDAQVSVGGASGTLTLAGAFSPSDLSANATSFDGSNGNAVFAAYCQQNDLVIIGCATDVGGNTVFAVDVTSGVATIQWVTDSLPFRPRRDVIKFEDGAVCDGDLIYLSDATSDEQRVIRITTNNGRVDGTLDGTTAVLSDEFNETIMYYGPLGQLWVNSGSFETQENSMKVYTFQLTEGADINPQTVVSGICAEVGLEGSDIDVSPLPITKDGFKSFHVLDRTTAFEALEPFLDVLQVDAFEEDGAVTFQPRGVKTEFLTITEDDLLADGDGLTYLRARLRDRELPLIFEVGYQDYDNQFQEGVQSDARESSAVQTEDTRRIDYPGALEADAARNVASLLLYQEWSERDRFKIQLPPQSLAISPSDIISLTLDTGEQVRLRVRDADLGANFVIEAQTVVEQSGIFVTPEISATSGDGNRDNQPRFVGDSSTFLFDMPLLRDVDAPSTGQTSTYWGGSGEETWDGVVLYRKTGDTQVETINKVTAALPFGTITTPLAASDRPFITEEGTSLVVTMTRGSEFLSSVTKNDILSDANVAIVVQADGNIEILQYQNVTPDGSNPDLLTLDTFLRGRRGTDTVAAAGGMAVGDQIYFVVSSSFVSRFTRDVSTLNASTDYRGVTAGQIFEDAEDFAFVDSGKDLAPYAPAPVEVSQLGGAGTDLIFNWKRRTRVGGNDDFLDGVTDVPLSEDSENYELVIYSDDTYTTEVRTIAATSETAIYGTADIITDGNPTTIYFRVFQLSDTVGRGSAYDLSTPRDLS